MDIISTHIVASSDRCSVFGSRLRELRLSKGLTQADLAMQIHLSATTINRYENGLREPSLDILSVIAEFFGVDFNCLLSHTGESPQKCNADLFEKFNALDDRGKSAVLNTLNHEYSLTHAK